MRSYSKESLTKAFVDLLSDNSYDDITLKDITSCKNVDRALFYHYYEDVEDMLIDFFDAEIKRISENPIVYPTWGAGFNDFADFIVSNPSAAQNICSSSARMYFTDYTDSIAALIVGNDVRVASDGLDIDDNDKSLILSFYIKAISGIIISWVDDGMEGDLSEKLNKLDKAFAKNIADSFKKIAPEAKPKKSFWRS